MSKSVENPAPVENAAEETPKKKFVFTRKQIAVAATATAVVGAAAVIAYKVKNGDFSDLTVGDLTVVEDLALEA